MLTPDLGSRPSIADPFVPFIKEVLEKYPRLTASLLFDMVTQRGYPGGPDHHRAIIARLRPRKPAENHGRIQGSPASSSTPRANSTWKVGPGAQWQATCQWRSLPAGSSSGLCGKMGRQWDFKTPTMLATTFPGCDARRADDPYQCPDDASQ